MFFEESVEVMRCDVQILFQRMLEMFVLQRMCSTYYFKLVLKLELFVMPRYEAIILLPYCVLNINFFFLNSNF